MEIIKRIKKAISAFKNKYFRTKTQLYSKVLIMFVVLFFGVLLEGLTHRTDSEFVETQLYEDVSVQSGNLSVVRKEYYDKDSAYRIDLYVDKNSNNDLDEVKINATAIEKSDTETTLSCEVVTVSDSYYVVYVKDLDINFEAIRIDLNYQVGDSSDQDIKFYCSKTDTELNSEQSIVSNSNEQYLIDATENDIRLQEVKITEIEKQIEDNEEEILLSEEKIAKLEEEKAFQVANELADTEQSIVNLTNSIANLEEEIKTGSEEIELIKDKISLLQEKIQSLKEYEESYQK